MSEERRIRDEYAASLDRIDKLLEGGLARMSESRFAPDPTQMLARQDVRDAKDRLRDIRDHLISFNKSQLRPRAGDLDRAVGEFIKRDSHDAGPGLNLDNEDRELDRDDFVGLGGERFIPGSQSEPSPDRDDALVDYPIRDPDESIRAQTLHRADRGAIILTILGFRRIRVPPPGPIDDISPEDWLSVLTVLQLVQSDGS